MQLDKSCEEQNIHADDIRGNFEMITKRKVEWNFSKLTPIRESLVKFVIKKQDWEGKEGKCTENNEQL